MQTQVFFLDGTIKCCQEKHLIFGIIAILILAFLVLPVPIITFLVAIGKAPTVSGCLKSSFSYPV